MYLKNNFFKKMFLETLKKYVGEGIIWHQEEYLGEKWKEKGLCLLRGSSPDFLYDIFTRFRDLGRFLQIAHATPIAASAHTMFNKHTSKQINAPGARKLPHTWTLLKTIKDYKSRENIQQIILTPKI